MTTALDIISRVARILHDESYTRWSKAEMLDWASEAQIAVARNPGVHNLTVTASLTSGARQSIPSDGWGLVSLHYNVDADGPVSAIRLTTRELLDAFVPEWHRVPKRPLVENYVYDDRTPKQYEVYPPNDGTGKVELTYMAIPARFTAETSVVVVDDTFIPALVDYVVYRAYCKESDYSSGITNAQGYFQAYQNELSSALATRGATTPNSAMMPGTIVDANGGTE